MRLHEARASPRSPIASSTRTSPPCEQPLAAPCRRPRCDPPSTRRSPCAIGRPAHSDQRPASNQRLHGRGSLRSLRQAAEICMIWQRERRRRSDANVSLPPSMTSRILVVDDSPTIRRVVSAILERHGYEAALASDGEDALAGAPERRGEGRPRPARLRHAADERLPVLPRAARRRRARDDARRPHEREERSHPRSVRAADRRHRRDHEAVRRAGARRGRRERAASRQQRSFELGAAARPRSRGAGASAARARDAPHARRPDRRDEARAHRHEDDGREARTRRPASSPRRSPSGSRRTRSSRWSRRCAISSAAARTPAAC